MKNTFVPHLRLCSLSLLGLCYLFAQANVGVWLTQLQSTDPVTRQAGFYAIEKAKISSANDQVKVALIALLATEEAFVDQQVKTGVDLGEGYSTYFSDVVTAVAGLHDNRSVNALSGVIQTGNMVADTLSAIGPAALPALTQTFQSADSLVRFGVVMTVNKMLKPANVSNVSDSVSRTQIRLILAKAVSDPDPGVAGVAQNAQAIFIPIDVIGDLNSDGKVDCVDVGIVKASLGKKIGQAGFDPRADVNLDGIVDIRDLAFVSQRLPSGTRCQ